MYISNLNASLSYYLGIIHVGEEVLVTHRGKTLFSRTTLFDRRKFRETASAVEHRAVGQGGLDPADAVRGNPGAVETHGFELGEFLKLLQLRVADLGVGKVEPGQSWPGLAGGSVRSRSLAYAECPGTRGVEAA